MKSVRISLADQHWPVGPAFRRHAEGPRHRTPRFPSAMRPWARGFGGHAVHGRAGPSHGQQRKGRGRGRWDAV